MEIEAVKMRVWIICSSFPPVNAAAVHRTTALCRRLVADGHEVVVLTMPPDPSQTIDEGLLRKVPEGLPVLRIAPWFGVHRTGSGPRPEGAPGSPGRPRPRRPSACRGGIAARIRDWASWWLHVPDSRIGWLVPAIGAGARQGWRSRPHVIYSTAPMWTAHLVGLSLARLLGRPWVADCRDPWVANPFRKFPYAAHRRADRWLEGRMVARAAFVICNTAPARREFIARYPRQGRKFVVVHNGYDAAEVDAIRRLPPPPTREFFSFIHVGSFYGGRSPASLLRALARLGRRRPDLRGRLRFRQVGPDCYDGRPLAELADRFGVGDMMEILGPLPHETALRFVHDSDVGVVAGHDGPGCDLQIPRKLFEYLGLGKPILVTRGTCRAVRELLHGHNADTFWLAGNGHDGGRRLSEIIEQIVLRWQAGHLPRQLESDKDFTAGRMASRIEAVLIRARCGRRTIPPEHAGSEEVLPC